MENSTKWLIIGGVFIGLIGPILHFAFEWTGWVGIGIFAPVNESPWEHIKLTFWPAMLILIFEYLFVYKKNSPNNFFLAKTIGILLMPVATLSLFYIYTAFLAENLMIDILTFYIAIIIGQLASYKLYHIAPVSEKLNKYSSIALVAFAFLVILFIFYPPHIPLFYDSAHGGYGILSML
jgi:hypothetical protein